MAKKKTTRTKRPDAPKAEETRLTQPLGTETPERTEPESEAAAPGDRPKPPATQDAETPTDAGDVPAHPAAPGDDTDTAAAPDDARHAAEPTGADEVPAPEADAPQGAEPAPGTGDEPAHPAEPWGDTALAAASDEAQHEADPTGTDEPPAPEADAPEGTPPQTAADPAASAAPVVRTEQVTVRKGGFWSMLLGGAAAAGIGIVAAPHVLPPEWFVTGPDESPLAERLEAMETRLSNLDIPSDQSGAIDGLSQTLTDLTGRIAALEAQVEELAARPAPGPAPDGGAGETVAVFKERLAAQTAEDAEQQGAIDALRAEIAALKDEAAAEEAAARDSAQAVLRRAALTRIRTALDTGESFAAALSELRDTGAEVPEALAALAETGVPTRAALAESFPEAARAALAAARAEAGEGASVSAFLRSQLGVRSLTPREGDDPDAVLSRAEAALAEERLADALAEIEALPETARAAMADWAAQARSRADALAAAEALSAAMN